MTELVRPWRGVSADDRRAERRNRLIEACLDQVAELGVAGTTVNGVCAAARLSKRYFYESFRDRETLLVAAMQTVVEGVYRAMADQLAALQGNENRAGDNPDIEALATLALRTAVEALVADPRRARLYREAPADTALNRARDDAVGRFAVLLLSHVPGTRPELAHWQAPMLALTFGSTEVIGQWLDGAIALTAEQLVARLAAVSAAGIRGML